MPEEKPTKFTGWKLNVPGAPQSKESTKMEPEPEQEMKEEPELPKVEEPMAEKPEPEKTPEPAPVKETPVHPSGPKFRWTGETVWAIADRFINWEIVALAFLLPIFFLPTTTEFFEFNKLLLLAVATVLGYLAWGIKSAAKKEVVFRPAFFDLPVLGIWVVTAVSTIFSDSQVTSLIGQFGRFYPSLFTVTIYTLFYFLASTNLQLATLKWVGRALILSAAAAVAMFIPQYFGVNLLGQAWSDGRAFTPVGSPSALALVALAGTLLAGREILSENWSKWTKGAFGLLALLLLAAPAAIYIPYDLAQKGGFPQEIKLDLQTSWLVSATAFRGQQFPIDPIVGTGPGTFLYDFTAYKPLNFNQSPYWSIRFDKPLSEYLLVLAEMGLLGVLAYLLLLSKFLTYARTRWGTIPTLLGGAVLVFYLISSASSVSTFLLFLALGSADLATNLWRASGPRLGWAAFVAASILALAFTLGFSRLYAADSAHRSSLNIIDKDAVAAYDLQRSAVQRFPWYDAYHSTFARTNFALANSLAGKESPTDEEKAQIQVLVSQAINEAREATKLAPQSAANWENLAQLYRTLIGLAQNAETWATDSYQRAVSLDLFNPLLRLSFGGLYYQIGQFDLAIAQFQAAVNLKSDWANAHYNLAVAYKEVGKIDLAIQELETALKLSTPETPGYAEAQKLLEELKAQQQ